MRPNPEPADDATRARFQRQPRRDTAPELAVRKELHRRGLRYRVDVPPIAGMRSRADLVFRGSRVAVFVDGCFWHSCPVHGTVPGNNREWWIAKLEANTTRDRRVDTELEDSGWLVIRVWEHEDAASAADRIEAAIRSRSRPAT